MESVIHAITHGRLGLTIVEENGSLAGVITDGDLRRGMTTQKNAFLSLKAEDIMSKTPVFIGKDMKLKTAEELMMERKINALLVVENQKCVGVLQMYDL